MKRPVLCLLSAMCACFLCSCSTKLPEQDAYNELVNYHKPEAVMYSVNIKGDTPLGKNIGTMIKNGYLVQKELPLGTYDHVLFDNSNKGVGIGYYDSRSEIYNVSFPIVRTKVGSVTDVSMEKDNDTAFVTYTKILEPVEPFYSNICIDPSCPYFENRINNKVTYRIKFKRNESGWKIDQGY